MHLKGVRQGFFKRRWFGGWFGRSSPKDPGAQTTRTVQRISRAVALLKSSKVETHVEEEKKMQNVCRLKREYSNQPDTSSTGHESDVQPGVVAELSSLLQSQQQTPRQAN